MRIQQERQLAKQNNKEQADTRLLRKTEEVRLKQRRFGLENRGPAEQRRGPEQKDRGPASGRDQGDSESTGPEVGKMT
jgi:hypothetical protein